jgi:hypothetical protein
MAAISRRIIGRYLTTASDGATTGDQGRALEDLACYLFGRVPGILITKRNAHNTFGSEEVDVALWNERRPRGLYFLPNVILIEAKGWSQPVGSSAVSWFDNKLRSRGMSFGVLIALNGITGTGADLTAAHQIVAGALREQRQLIVVTRTDLEQLGTTEDLVLLIKGKICELAVTGSLVS